jgi:hypothetical protein
VGRRDEGGQKQDGEESQPNEEAALVSVENFEPQAEELASQFEQAEAAIGAILVGLAAAGSVEAIVQAATAVVEIERALLKACVLWAATHVPLIYLSGMTEAVESMKILGGPSQDEIREEARGMMRRQDHRNAAALLEGSLRDDLANATQNMTRDAKNALREIAQRRIREALNRGNPMGEVAEFRREVEERGVRFVDKGGREWAPSKYARMVLLTATADTLNSGHVNVALELGSPGVAVSDGGPGDVDEPCKQADGQRWGLAYAARNRIQHPNCRRSFAALPRQSSVRLDRE